MRYLILIMGLLLSGCEAAAQDQAELPPKPQKVVRPVEQASTPSAKSKTVERASSRVHLVGKTEPHRSSAVAVAGGSGLIVRVFVREGDFVKRGQLLARLDASSPKLRLRQAQAGLSGAKVRMAAAERELKRISRLAKDNAVPQADVDRVTTAFDGATAGLAAAQVTADIAKKSVKDTEVRAPFAGLVTKRLKAEGEWVATVPPSPVIKLQEVTPLDLTLQAPEHLLPKIKIGDTVFAHFPAINRKIEASVTRIVPSVRAATRTFTIVVEIPNQDRSLQSGLFAEVVLSRNGAEE